eukprot:1016763-Prymnesium_polylepis.1
MAACGYFNCNNDSTLVVIAAARIYIFWTMITHCRVKLVETTFQEHTTQLNALAHNGRTRSGVPTCTSRAASQPHPKCVELCPADGDASHFMSCKCAQCGRREEHTPGTLKPQRHMAIHRQLRNRASKTRRSLYNIDTVVPPPGHDEEIASCAVRNERASRTLQSRAQIRLRVCSSGRVPAGQALRHAAALDMRFATKPLSVRRRAQ